MKYFVYVCLMSVVMVACGVKTSSRQAPDPFAEFPQDVQLKPRAAGSMTAGQEIIFQNDMAALDVLNVPSDAFGVQAAVMSATSGLFEALNLATLAGTRRGDLAGKIKSPTCAVAKPQNPGGRSTRSIASRPPPSRPGDVIDLSLTSSISGNACPVNYSLIANTKAAVLINDQGKKVFKADVSGSLLENFKFQKASDEGVYGFASVSGSGTINGKLAVNDLTLKYAAVTIVKSSVSARSGNIEVQDKVDLVSKFVSSKLSKLVLVYYKTIRSAKYTAELAVKYTVTPGSQPVVQGDLNGRALDQKELARILPQIDLSLGKGSPL